MPISPPYLVEITPPTLPIKAGSPAADVRRLQEWLVVQGYDVGLDKAKPQGSQEAAGIDGDFGNMTDMACRNFAHDHNFPYIGVDLAFWLKLVQPMNDALAYKPTERSFGPAMLQVGHAWLAVKPMEARVLRDGSLWGQDNSGPYVGLFNHGLKGDGAAWCLGVVDHLIEQTARALNCAPPLSTILDGVRSLWVPRMVQEAKEKGIYLGGGAAIPSALKPGSVFFLIGHGSIDHTHTGIVEGANASGMVQTLEGNTNTDGSSNGYEFIRRTRSIASCDYAVIA